MRLIGRAVLAEELPGVVDQLEADGVDSLWFSELVYSPAVDPFAGMGYALGRSTPASGLFRGEGLPSHLDLTEPAPEAPVEPALRAPGTPGAP